jgi:pimeloyl-ACP methyl ester carboxylesterase
MTQPQGVRLATVADHPPVAEVPVYVSSGGQQVGAVVSVPSQTSSTPYGVVLMAGRARDRAHRNGMWVRTAEALAARGIYALRLDYPGVGNSSGPPEVFDLERPPAWAVRDACGLLLRETPVQKILLVGTCFGGRVVLEAANEIPEVEAIAIVSAPVFARTRTIRLRLRRKVARGLGRSGPVHKPTSAAMQRREGGLPLEARVSPGFARSIRRFIRRGRVYLLYGEGDFVWDEMRFALERLKLPSDRYDLDVVPDEIHLFRTLTVQQMTIDRVVAWCALRAEEGPTWDG